MQVIEEEGGGEGVRDPDDVDPYANNTHNSDFLTRDARSGSEIVPRGPRKRLVSKMVMLILGVVSCSSRYYFGQGTAD